MKLGICQMDVKQGQVAVNEETAERMIREAAVHGAEVVVLPEMWNSGYDFHRLAHHQQQLDGSTIGRLSALARELGLWIMGGSVPIEYGDGVCNTAVSLDAKGNLVHVYRKVHLIGLMDEDKYLLPGEELSCFSIETAASLQPVLAATIICYDLRFPELAREAMKQGAKLLFVPAEWPVQRKDHWDTLLRARAIENQMFVVGVNMAGRNENDEFAGGSKVINPWGKTMAEAGSAPTILYADINLDEADEVRNRVPSLRDRRESVYARFARESALEFSPDTPQVLSSKTRGD